MVERLALLEQEQRESRQSQDWLNHQILKNVENLVRMQACSMMGVYTLTYIRTYVY